MSKWSKDPLEQAAVFLRYEIAKATSERNRLSFRLTELQPTRPEGKLARLLGHIIHFFGEGWYALEGRTIRALNRELAKLEAFNEALKAIDARDEDVLARVIELIRSNEIESRLELEDEIKKLEAVTQDLLALWYEKTHGQQSDIIMDGRKEPFSQSGETHTEDIQHNYDDTPSRYSDR